MGAVRCQSSNIIQCSLLFIKKRLWCVSLQSIALTSVTRLSWWICYKEALTEGWLFESVAQKALKAPEKYFGIFFKTVTFLDFPDTYCEGMEVKREAGFRCPA